LGVIGLSDGNGHPYSWSAIFNGYDPVSMEECGFPAIPRYLGKQRFPEDAIPGASVTHVWAQDRLIARHIAKATHIATVVERHGEMIGKVDAVLLARDDAESHLEFAAPFLEAGIPVYIDKPLAVSVAAAKRLLSLQRYPGQVFSCSALRYARELQLTPAQRAQVGRLRHIHAVVPKDWDRYAVHAIEPMLLIATDRGALEDARSWRTGDATTLAGNFRDGPQFMISALGACPAPIAIRVFGDVGWKELVFDDAFFAFKAALQEFVHSVVRKDVRIDPDFTLEVVGLIERGRVP
jgi:hypothetical protein